MKATYFVIASVLFSAACGQDQKTDRRSAAEEPGTEAASFTGQRKDDGSAAFTLRLPAEYQKAPVAYSKEEVAAAFAELKKNRHLSFRCKDESPQVGDKVKVYGFLTVSLTGWLDDGRYQEDKENPQYVSEKVAIPYTCGSEAELYVTDLKKGMRYHVDASLKSENSFVSYAGGTELFYGSGEVKLVMSPRTLKDKVKVIIVVNEGSDEKVHHEKSDDEEREQPEGKKEI